MNSSLESLGRLRLQGILLLTGVFLIGALAGAAFERARVGHPFHEPLPPQGSGLPPGLRDALGLTEDQETRIRVILETGRPRTDSVMNEFLPRLRAVTDSIRAEVRTLLTPEQQEIFDSRQPPLGPPPHGMPPPRDAPPPPPPGGGR